MINKQLDKNKILEYCKLTKRLKTQVESDSIYVEYNDVWIKIKEPSNDEYYYTISSGNVKFTAMIQFYDDILDNLIMCSSRVIKGGGQYDI